MGQTPEAVYKHISRVSLGDILRRSALRWPERTALIDGELELSYAELDRRANAFAHHLLGEGLSPGARVAMLCGNSAQMVTAFFGIYKAGLVWVPINTGLSVEAIGYILEHAEVSRVVIDLELLAKPELRAMLDARGLGLIVCVPEGQAAPGGGTVAFLDTLKGQHGTPPAVDIESTQLAQIMYTSGTTGQQKGVMHSHASIHSALSGNLFELELRPSDVTVCVLPMFHCAQHAVSVSFLMAGATVIVRRVFEPGAMLATIERRGVTFLLGLPIMYGAMLAHPARPTTKLSSLRMCLYVMAPMARTLLVELLEKFCPGGFALASGQTEMYPATTMFKPEQQLKRFGSYWGDSVVTNETAIMDDEGRLLGRGEVGEIVHRGPNVMLGYYKDPEATERARAFGWHHTGDLGMFDADGQLLFVDRKKDMIKTGGENVPSIKVEEVLLRHPAVLQVAVVGLPHPRWAEAVTGFVVLKPGASATAPDLITHCKQHLGGFEVPKSVVLLEAMPQTSTGKAQKFVLRQQHERHYQDDAA
ncbi:AMP-binding protein [Myxococcus sp. MISCRS1]|jgi:long-chain acyl-CoA synthetase|uniref:AMP-binding protein n=1 Tax=Myxococcus TaxID=32 RepID=UPI001CC17347|nr:MULTISPECIES: AMP-binding protein [unclassified Myxococcus]MBZ4414600.1 AMP-binding protein [Myxococcus sp. XM-1-1-1]MCY0997573.1 AMP-binding protein [Myxococcus sp. MISCRS1]BDT32415.1 AMP-binding protein [Myxococcus sp. MH1]